jgi:hypothetical protein
MAQTPSLNTMPLRHARIIVQTNEEGEGAHDCAASGGMPHPRG